MDARGGEIGRPRDHHRPIHHHEFVVHQTAAGAAIGGVIDQGHTGPLQDGHRIAPAERLELVVPVALVRCQTDRILFRPWSAVGVFQHHLHRQSLAMAGNQGFGHLRQRELLHRHQNLPLRLLDAGKHKGLQVVALAPLARDRAAVAAGVGVVEHQLDALGQGRVLGGRSQQLGFGAAAGQAKPQQTGPGQRCKRWAEGFDRAQKPLQPGFPQARFSALFISPGRLVVPGHLSAAQHDHKPDGANQHGAEHGGWKAKPDQHHRHDQGEGQGPCHGGKGHGDALQNHSPMALSAGLLLSSGVVRLNSRVMLRFCSPSAATASIG